MLRWTIYKLISSLLLIGDLSGGFFQHPTCSIESVDNIVSYLVINSSIYSSCIYQNEYKWTELKIPLAVTAKRSLFYIIYASIMHSQIDFPFLSMHTYIHILTDHSPNGAFQGQWNQMMKQIMQMNITWLKIPTGGRQTSWLFTSMTEELNYGLSRNNSGWVVRAGLESATSGFQVRRPNHSATLPPISYISTYLHPLSVFSFKDRLKDRLTVKLAIFPVISGTNNN